MVCRLCHAAIWQSIYRLQFPGTICFFFFYLLCNCGFYRLRCWVWCGVGSKTRSAQGNWFYRLGCGPGRGPGRELGRWIRSCHGSRIQLHGRANSEPTTVWLTVGTSAISETFNKAISETFAPIKVEDGVQTKRPRRLTISVQTKLNRPTMPSTVVCRTLQPTVDVI